MLLRALALLLLVPLCHYSYHLFSGWDANWCQWVAEHGAGVVVCLVVLDLTAAWPRAARWVVVAAMGWTIVEDLQAAVCGWLRWGPGLPGDNQICRDGYGTMPYRLLFSASVAYLVVRGRSAWTGLALGR